MVVVCPSCQKRFRLEEKHFQGRPRFRFQCPSCGQAIEAVRETGVPPPGAAEAPPPSPPSTQKLRRVEGTWSESQVPDAELLALPEGKRISLAVIQGPDTGRIFPVTRPVFVIGRQPPADAVLSDGEVSRSHAQVEFRGTSVTLRDLKSTNGTYVNEQRIVAAPIENQTEFRVGATTLLLIVTDDLV